MIGTGTPRYCHRAPYVSRYCPICVALPPHMRRVTAPYASRYCPNCDAMDLRNAEC